MHLNPSDNREALLIEYCNGGSLHNVLELPENRCGLNWKMILC